MLGLLNVVGEQHVGIVFRFGKPRPARGPGRVWLIPRVDQLVVVDLRPTVIDIPPLVATTKDGQALSASAHVHAQIVSPEDAAVRVVDYVRATSQLSEAALRPVLGPIYRLNFSVCSRRADLLRSGRVLKDDKAFA